MSNLSIDTYYTQLCYGLESFVRSKVEQEVNDLTYEDVPSIMGSVGSRRRDDIDTAKVREFRWLRDLLTERIGPLAPQTRYTILREAVRAIKGWATDPENPLNNRPEQLFYRKLINVHDNVPVMCEEINATFMWVSDRLFYYDPERKDFGDEIADHFSYDEITHKDLWVSCDAIEEWAVLNPSWWQYRHTDVEGYDCCADPECGLRDNPTAYYQPKLDKETRQRRKAYLAKHFS
ncbi:hypothetical protein SEA_BRUTONGASTER_56 [Gordonia phage BrutonGaster]|uniref:Uncharacterized protein n=1 Tax=Gordonia phage BrutonGaster TaxID=2530116 RepID=A0A482JKI1_9CAUD|nr:hypothetical protein HOV26_gp126 [Gordonia phage BrutonGaster]QBP33273.1 hypothetical protein SEA_BRUTONGASTER_56 [Gordonia phage BrutonGaster]